MINRQIEKRPQLSCIERVRKEIFSAAKKLALLLNIAPAIGHAETPNLPAVDAASLVESTEEIRLTRYGEIVQAVKYLEDRLLVGIQEGVIVYPKNFEAWQQEAVEKFVADYQEQHPDEPIDMEIAKQQAKDNLGQYIFGDYEHPLLLNHLLLDVGIEESTVNKFHFTGGLRFLLDPKSSAYGVKDLSLYVGAGWRSIGIDTSVNFKRVGADLRVMPSIADKKLDSHCHLGVVGHYHHDREQGNGYGANLAVELHL